MQQSLKKTAVLQKMFTQVNHHRHPQAMNMVSDIIKPETSLEKTIIQQSDWMEGAFWGEPRSGHPEGKVIFHIREVLDNVDRITNNQILRQQLRLVTIIHDNFKHLEETVRPRQDWNRHHAVFAMKFAQNFIEQQHILDIIELHDEAYYAWHHSRKMEMQSAAQRLNILFEKLGEDYKQLYYLFFKCDTFTGDKTPNPVRWFEDTVKDIKIAAL
jgi:hypothetical protein